MTLTTPEHVTIVLSIASAANAFGVLVNFANARLGAIDMLSIAVRQARSFDSSHHAYRFPAGFNAGKVDISGQLQAGCAGNPVWLVRKEFALPNLFALNNGTHPMVWPNNDHSKVQRWNLDLLFTYRPLDEEYRPLSQDPNVIDFSLTVLADIANKKMELSSE